VVAVVELDPWGGETDRSVNQRQQPYRYTTYERDGDGVDQALMRSYHGWWTRFNEPDPWEGSYDLTDPQSFNRYSYVQNDPVNYVDPTGLVSDEEVIRIETRAPRWVDDFWLRHALGVLFDAGSVCGCGRSMSRELAAEIACLRWCRGSITRSRRDRLAKNKTLISAAELAASVRKNSAPSRKLL